LLAIAALLVLAGPAQRAHAASLLSPLAAIALQQAPDAAAITEVRWRRHYYYRHYGYRRYHVRRHYHYGYRHYRRHYYRFF
jgi:hypothetical protein